MSQNKELTVAAVIFDLDGTLIDSIDIYFRIVENALERLGLPPVSRTKILTAAESEDFKWELVLPQEVQLRRASIIEEAWGVINEIAPQMFADDLDIIEGADGALKMVSAKGLKIGLVTSTQKHYLETKMLPLKNAGVDDLIEATVTSDDVDKRKPAPDPLVLCARKLALKPAECVYIGDTATDMQAGKAAGMQTIGVLTGFDDYDALSKEQPDAIIDSIRHLGEVLAP
ncbi:MAG: HAD family hydrolase, partial [Desulfobacterales bacterium]|jgi:HAD superfamily hydrolase (TIGR01509 family)